MQERLSENWETKNVNEHIKNPIEIGKIEAFELCQGNLPTAKRVHLIIRMVGLGDSIIYKQNNKYFIADYMIKLKPLVKEALHNGIL